MGYPEEDNDKSREIPRSPPQALEPARAAVSRQAGLRLIFLDHPRCVHVLRPFVERLATEEEKEPAMVRPEVLNRGPAELQRRYRKGKEHAEL